VSGLREDGIVSAADGSVRGTQSFVHTLSECWRRPSLTGLEVLWRWLFGIPALLIVWTIARRILAEAPLNFAALRAMTVTNPLKASETLAEAMAVLLPPLSRVGGWLVPLLLVSWVIWSSLGRTVVLRRVDGTLQARPLTLMALQAIRVVALAGSFAVWFLCLQWAANTTVTAPLEHGGEPNLVGYFAMGIVLTLGLFTLWAVVSWVLSVAPLLAMLRGLGVRASLAAAFRLGPLKSKLVEINLVMGIVKIALIVLAMVFSATPLPFESVTTPEFLTWWWIGVAVLYFIASDFFHVARLVGYLHLWRAFEKPVER
jgi:hypothetical protein